MRSKVFAVGSIVLLSFAFQVNAEAVEPATGIHDPEALTCDSPLLVPAAKAIGWKICVQNNMLETLSQTGALNPGGPVLRKISDLPLVVAPTGQGDPAAVTCRSNQTGTKALVSPIACAHNAFWAKLSEAGCILSPNARVIMRSGTAKVFKPLACQHIKGSNGLLPREFF